MSVTKFDPGCCNCRGISGGCDCCTGVATNVVISGLKLYRPWVGVLFNNGALGWCAQRSLFGGCYPDNGLPVTSAVIWDGVTELPVSSPYFVDQFAAGAAFGNLVSGVDLDLRSPPYDGITNPACQSTYYIGGQELVRPQCINTGLGATGLFCKNYEFTFYYGSNSYLALCSVGGGFYSYPVYPTAHRSWITTASVSAWIGKSTRLPNECRFHLAASANTNWGTPTDVSMCGLGLPYSCGSAAYWYSEPLDPFAACPTSIPLTAWANGTVCGSGGILGIGKSYYSARWTNDTLTATLTY